MDFEHSEKALEIAARVRLFIQTNVIPNFDLYCQQRDEGNRFAAVPLMKELQAKAKADGLWNMFMPPTHGAEPVSQFEFEGTQLTNLEYAVVAEELGPVQWSSECFNSQAPDTGNMEVLMRY